jgi:hypothetical protein
MSNYTQGSWIRKFRSEIPGNYSYDICQEHTDVPVARIVYCLNNSENHDANARLIAAENA